MKTAVRAFNKIFNPIAANICMGAELDRGFDGGEFSGAAHDGYFEFEWNRVLGYVAERFQVEPNELADEMYFCQREELYHMTQH